VEFVVRDDGPGILPQFHDKILRSDEDLKKSIVFIMTTSDGDEDKVKAYNLGVAGYILKSTPANAFLEATALLDTYWRVVEFTAA
jgi:DNA-binding NarL/FixJ family response regulator